MSDFSVCFSWMMDNEDRGRKYKTVPDAPPGAQAISGINSAAFPDDFKKINAIPQAKRGPAVQSFYRENFWNKWFDQIESDEVAKRVFDAAVNMGPGTAVKLLQEAAGCPVDGLWGPDTLAAVNAEGDALIDVFKQERSAHYQDIVLNDPEDAPYLGAWLARANA